MSYYQAIKNFEELENQLEEVRHVGGLTLAEMRSALTLIRNFETCVSYQSSLKDYEAYIKYLTTLYQYLFEEKGVETDSLDKLLLIIQTLYRRVNSKYPKEISFWHKHIEFMEEHGFLEDITDIYKKAIKRVPENAKLFSDFVDFLDKVGDEMTRTAVLVKASRLHPTDPNIKSKLNI